MPSNVNQGAAFHAEALRILRDIPGIDVVPEARVGNRRIDATVRFAGTETEVAIEFKARANAAAAWQIIQYAGQLEGTPLLLVADETTADAREILREHGIALVDGLGNAHMELPGLLLHLQGDKRRPRREPPARLIGKAGAVAQALLLDPERSWQINELAERARVSAGLAHRVVARLDREGVMTSEGAGPQRVRRVANPTALLDLWAEEDRPRARRTPGYLLARSPEQLLMKLGETLDGRDIEYAVTGAGAASLVVPFVTAVPVVNVWTTAGADPNELLSALGAEAVDSGQNVVLLQAKQDTPLAFREKASSVWVTNRFRMYADLLADPRRGTEQAKNLRSEVIGY